MGSSKSSRPSRAKDNGYMKPRDVVGDAPSKKDNPFARSTFAPKDSDGGKRGGVNFIDSPDVEAFHKREKARKEAHTTKKNGGGTYDMKTMEKWQSQNNPENFVKSTPDHLMIQGVRFNRIGEKPLVTTSSGDKRYDRRYSTTYQADKASRNGNYNLAHVIVDEKTRRKKTKYEFSREMQFQNETFHI